MALREEYAMTLRLLVAALAISLLPAAAHAVFFDFSDTLVVDFQSFEHDGVRFSVDPVGFASYGTGFWSGADYVQGSALEVDTGATLTMVFVRPMRFVQFGAGVGGTSVLNDVTSIHAFSEAGFEVLPVAVEPPMFGGLGEGERRFTYLADDVVRIELSVSALAQSVLAIDNLTLTPQPASDAAEPGVLRLLLACTAIFAVHAFRHRVQVKKNLIHASQITWRAPR